MSMYAETVKTGAAAVRRAGKKDPMALLATLREEDKTGSFEVVITRWKKLVEDDPDYCDTALLYAARNYWSQLERDEARFHRPQKTPQQLAEQHQTATQSIQQLIHQVEKAVLLNFVLSNGKKLRDCTGAECIREGGWLIAVGRKVGKRRVGDVLSEKQVVALRK